MAVKKYRVSGSTEKKVEVISKVLFKELLSDTESLILSILLDYSTNNTITLSVDVTKQVKSQAGVTDSSFSTSIYRLEKKGLIIRAGKNIQFHPALNNIHSMDSLIINFQNPL